MPRNAPSESRASPITIGWREWIQLPELGLPPIKAKVDTGARTSCLHAFAVEPLEQDGRPYVRFGVHPKRRRQTPEIWCTCPVHDQRIVTDSGGHREMRYVIQTSLCAGPNHLTAELTLTNRDDMMFRMLLGRVAIAERFIVDPSRSYVFGNKSPVMKEQSNT